ncbi:nucleoid-associated protein [Dyadobacter diqingensis]|uniref:nucleoid-associated protein n=1 Tax=Dyadobacter diqingensis TaxID=2938121 RepID=UPI0020C1B944|nr:nucleoid-associated protein [Dyadobacter diqingensis]
MVDINNAIIRDVIIHKVNSSRDSLKLNENVIEVSDEDQESTLRRILLKSFSSASSTYEFSHNIDIDLNTLFKISKDIYGGSDFINSSKNIATHLFTSSRHPGIKDGDLFIAKFDDIKLKDTFHEAIGIYKFENKESFVEITGNDKDNKIGIKFRQGIGSKKPEKACLILFTDDRYTVFLLENSNSETEYWTHDFLGVEPKRDNVNSTNHVLSLTKAFVTEKLPEDHEASRADQIDLLNRSVSFFKQHETFSNSVFEREVLQDENIIESFRTFNNLFKEERKLEWQDNFAIAQDVVKKQARIFKKVLKLDKNFDIYIHGEKSLIERGVEDDGRKFYKIYYNQEM